MITRAWKIRDAVEADLPLLRTLFAEEGFGDISTPENIRVAATSENVIYGALRTEQMSDGIWYVRPVVVFESVRGLGVGRALVQDALKRHVDLRLVAEGHATGFYRAVGFQECTFDEVDDVLVGECNECPGRATCHPQPFRSAQPDYTFTFLGTTSGCGVPAFFCHCLACEAARKDSSLRRGCTGALIQGNSTILIDTPPDVRHQLIRENVDDIDEVFLTHAHFDHLGGFGELEYLVRLYRDEPLPFHASPYALKEALAEFHYMDDCFICDEIEPFQTREVDGLTIQALPLNHCPGCYGYLIETPQGRRTFYAPDTAAFEPEVFELLKGVDNFILDSSFWKDVGNFRTHHSVQQTIEEGLELGAKTIYLTHIAPHICEPDENVVDLITEHIAQYDGRVVLAYDGLKVKL